MDNMTHAVTRSTTEAVPVEAERTQVVTRIGFAERWLHRARARYADGDAAGGLLTLALADAEVRYALEAAGVRRAAAASGVPARRVRPVWVLAAAAAAVAVAWVSLSGPAPTTAAVDGPPVVRFARVGSLLTSMPVPSGPSAVDSAAAVAGPGARSQAVARRIPRIDARGTQRVMERPAVVASPSVHASTAGTAAVSAAPPAAPASAASTPVSVFALSDADLIEMVLAASRALQGTGP